MKKKHRLCLIAVLSAGLTFTLADCGKMLSQPVSFTHDIKPLLEAQCVNCHYADAMFGDLNLENRELAFKPRVQGAAITPGKPDKSPLYLVLTFSEGDKTAMPPTGHRISPAEAALIKRWIEQGATWPTGPDGVVKPTVPPDPKGT